ncbi:MULTISPECIES: helix-turn-helix domain-containing protein [Streptomyces]|uniref:helix-turn-helix domain-containing protein n=1 Tax=Streptomyces TaxID=1883 RepID=UPI000CF2D1AB|nr:MULTISPECIES: helix-turn-helix transcriptional regulator [Streptomyces]PPS77986.1 transcriptional regulator [Streptomyces sp. 46]
MSESTGAGATEEAEAFAELLRGLKERSGLSYVALAKRLHMSASTLHRYCIGRAVPTEYAPVERLARKCRATGEELVELHRRWILADATRTRRGPGQGGTEPGTGPDGAGPERTAPASDSSEPDECDEPVVSDAVPSVPPPTRTRLRWSRRHTLIACAVATATLGSVALAAGLPFSGDDDRGPIHAGDDTWKVGTDEDVSPLASTLPNPPRDTKSGKSTAPGSGDHDGAPVKVTTRPYVYDDPCGQHFLVDSGPKQVGPPATEQDAPQWAAAYGAVSSGQQRVALTVQGTGKDTVVLEALHVRITAKRDPLTWNDYSMGVGCGDSVKAKSFDVDLDKRSPTVTAENGQHDFPLTVSESDPKVFHVTARTTAHDVRWDLALDWSSGDRHGTVRINSKGTPFRTSADIDRPGYDYPLSGGGWVKRKG